MWPTPDAFVSNDGEAPETFEARRSREIAKGQNGNGMGTPLAMAVKLWPTPATRDWKGANGAEHLENSTGSLHLDQLPNFVEHLWKTPRVSAGGYTRDNGDPEKERPTLAGQATQWPTPRQSMSRGNGNPTRAEDSGNCWIEDTASAFSLPAPETPTDGEPSSSAPRSLNPRFVEWLMGWPPGWTLLASMNSGCSGTASYRYKQPSLSEPYPTVSEHKESPSHGEPDHDPLPADEGERQEERMRYVRVDVHASQDEARSETDMLAGLHARPPIRALAGTPPEEFLTWRRRMRSELSRIALPIPAPAAQLDLFGA